MSCILVTGPARSGKSEWAEALALQRQQAGQQVTYIATATVDPNDAEWQARIQQHQQRRPPTWRYQEVPSALATAIQQATSQDCLLVDSLGTWLANLLEQDEPIWTTTQVAFCQALQQTQSDVILVAEETGWGVVPSYPVGRLFRDRLGTLTRRVGAIAGETYLVTAGHVLSLSAIATPLSKALI
ncbi:MAG: bifunctional adenosylcobinamide kinase/adenosylcobinamide-phosphate guanylyltransferase [Cyanobacteria bacterium P01_A01_bin.135]